MELLIGLGFGSIGFDQLARTLSGGQKTRLALARMLFMQSSILLLDEPTNHIDESALVWLTTYLKKSDATMVIVSHLSTFLDDVANKIMYIEDTKLQTYPGDYSNYGIIAKSRVCANLKLSV
jgi:ATP-binding cassette subfamily F protein 3